MCLIWTKKQNEEIGHYEKPFISKRKSERFKLLRKKTSGNPSKRGWNYLSTLKEQSKEGEWSTNVYSGFIMHLLQGI